MTDSDVQSEAEVEQDGEVFNDDWTGKNLTWGEEFWLKLEAQGRESVGQIGLLVADKAAVAHLSGEDKFAPPTDGKPQWRHMAKATATFETEHATMTAELRSDKHLHEDAEALFSHIKQALDDPAQLDKVTVDVQDQWERRETTEAA